MKRGAVQQQPAWVLHRRAYRESSALVEFFTANHGRICGVVRGIQRPKAPLSALCQQFRPLLIDWTGKQELKSIVAMEAAGEAFQLQGSCLYSGFYANELLVRTLAQGDPHTALFAAYHKLLGELASGTEIEPVLRAFEMSLLHELGYSHQFDKLAGSGEDVDSDDYYEFVSGHGVVRAEGSDKIQRFSGGVLKSVQSSEFTTPEVLRAAKLLLREALRPLLGGRPLASRELFQQLNTDNQFQE